MSYLTLSGSIPSSRKAVISLWFRIPQATIDAAAREFEAAYNTGDPESLNTYGSGWRGGGGGAITYEKQPPQMAGIIPLLIFGKPGSENNLTNKIQNFGSWTARYYFWEYTAFPVGRWVLYDTVVNQIEDRVDIRGSTKWTTEPSYIGVWCTGNPQRALLAVNLETGSHASISGGNLIIVDHTVLDRSFYDGPAAEMPARTWGATTTYGGDTSIFYPITESFRTHPLVRDIAQYDGTSENSPPFGITVTPDKWHHLLLSFDLTIPCATHGISTNDEGEMQAAFNAPNPSVFTDSAPKMWIAYDGENKKGRDLSYYWTGKGARGEFTDPPMPDLPDGGGDPNEVLSHNAWRIAGLVCGADSTEVIPPPDHGPLTDPETNVFTTAGLKAAIYSFSSPPLPTEPMGLPGMTEWVDHIHHVEMAEFQMFTDVTLDTSDVTSVRAFISAQGEPVPPARKQAIEADGSTTVGSILLMGKTPEVLLHGQTNWIKGKNTGTSGQFTPTGAIKRYKPDPAIGA
jgi:hypothetical protein